jgi:hypothetical protein
VSEPRIEIKGLTTKQARRLADIGDALQAGGIEVEAFLDPHDYVLAETCEYCGWTVEAGHCYTCKPVFGYGENRLPRPGSRAENGHPGAGAET